MMLMYALLEFYNTGSVDITAICVNNQIESSQITWSATQQGNSENVERQHLFRQHLCRWVFKANCASFLRWFLQTLSLACRHIGSILNFLSLFRPSLSISLHCISCHKLLFFFFKFNLLLSRRQMKTMTKSTPKAHAPWLQKEWQMLHQRIPQACRPQIRSLASLVG